MINIVLVKEQLFQQLFSVSWLFSAFCTNVDGEGLQAIGDKTGHLVHIGFFGLGVNQWTLYNKSSAVI